MVSGLVLVALALALALFGYWLWSNGSGFSKIVGLLLALAGAIFACLYVRTMVRSTAWVWRASPVATRSTSWAALKRALNDEIRLLNVARSALVSKDLPATKRALEGARLAVSAEVAVARQAFQTAQIAVGTAFTAGMLDALDAIDGSHTMEAFSIARSTLDAAGRAFIAKDVPASAHRVLASALDAFSVVQCALGAHEANLQAFESTDGVVLGLTLDGLDTTLRTLEREVMIADAITRNAPAWNRG